MEHPWLDPEAARSALGFPLVELLPAATTSAREATRSLVAQAHVTQEVHAYSLGPLTCDFCIGGLA
jgi:hypothetical protein